MEILAVYSGTYRMYGVPKTTYRRTALRIELSVLRVMDTSWFCEKIRHHYECNLTWYLYWHLVGCRIPFLNR